MYDINNFISHFSKSFYFLKCVLRLFSSQKKKKKKIPISIFLASLVVFEDNQEELNLLNKEYIILFYTQDKPGLQNFQRLSMNVQGKLNLLK